MGEWKTERLGSLLEVKYGKDHKALQDGTTPCIGSGGIMRFVNDYLYDRESILIPRKGSLNNIMYQNSPFWTVDTMFWTKLNDTKIFPKFLFYQLTLIDYTNLNVGSAVPSLTVPVINEIEVNVPPLPTQKAISNILTCLDDKIDLLSRQNKTLEQLAETLFRQWFIEEAKEDWEVKSVSHYAIHLKKSVTPKKNEDIKYIHYSIPSFDNSKKPSKEMGGSIQSNKYEVPKNSILFSKLNPHKDKRIWLLQDEVIVNSVCSTEFQVVYPKSEIYLCFLYGWLSFNENYKELASGIGGTSGSHQRIDPKSIFNFPCPLVSDKHIERFNVLVEDIYKKQVINQQQVYNLEKIRNTLLPKLMSGEVKVIIDE